MDLSILFVCCDAQMKWTCKKYEYEKQNKKKLNGITVVYVYRWKNLVEKKNM